MYVNAALIRPGHIPGQYPSGGPLPHLFDVWRAGAPTIDFLSPDIYFQNFAEWARKYDRSGNPFFIPEAGTFPMVPVNMLYAIGHVSGCHLNPAVTVGLVVGGRFSARELPAYVVAQVIGAILAAGVLCIIASGAPGFSLAGGLASNGYAEHSPGGYSLLAGFVAETVLTFFFLFVILGATDNRAPAGFAPIPIGLALALIHLIGIPVTNVSVNPARSTGPAVFVGGWAVAQLWMFWVAPCLGAALAGLAYPRMFGAGAAPAVKGVKEPAKGTVAPGA